MLETIINIATWSFLFFPIITIYVTLVHIKWWNLYKPSPLIKHLLISSIAIDISAISVAIIAADGLDILPFDLPDGVPTLMLASALFIAMGIKVYRRIGLRALDNPDEDLEQRVETQNQREDRQFGEERRKLEIDHISELESDHAIDADDAYAEGLAAGRDEELKDQSEDRLFGNRRRVLEEEHRESD